MGGLSRFPPNGTWLWLGTSTFFLWTVGSDDLEWAVRRTLEALHSSTDDTIASLVEVSDGDGFGPILNVRPKKKTATGIKCNRWRGM